MKYAAHRRSRRIVVAALLGAVLFVVLVLLLAWRGAPLFADFKGYRSAQALAGSSVEKTELIRVKERGLDIWRFDYVQEYDSGVILYERRVGEYASSVGCEAGDSSRHGDYSNNCTEAGFKGDGKYTIKTSLHKGELYSVRINAQLGETEFYVHIPEGQLQTYAEYDGWQQYFEAMEPVSLTFMPYKKRQTQIGGS